MKKILLATSVLVLLASLSFAVASINLNVGVLTSESSPNYTIGATIKSIGAIGFELTVEGNMGTSFDLGKVGSIEQWNLLPSILFSLPTGEIRPYIGLGIKTVYDVKTNSFGPIALNPLYYRGGVDLFYRGFSAFIEAQGTFQYQPEINFGGVNEWRLGAGLSF